MRLSAFIIWHKECFRFFGFAYIFYNLPPFISQVSWIITHNLCLGNHEITK